MSEPAHIGTLLPDIEGGSSEMVEGLCNQAGCDNVVTKEKLLADLWGPNGPCEVCLTAYDGKKVDQSNPRLSKFEAICPHRFLEGSDATRTDHEHFPRRNWDEKVSGWRYGPNGLLLQGDTGTAKSRCMFLLLKRLIMDEGHDAIVLFPEDLSLMISAAYGKGEDEAMALLRKWETVEILAFDDLFEEKLTDRAQSAFFRVIDVRTRECRPVIATTQKSGDVISGSFEDLDRAQAVIRRLATFCTKVAM